jgi:hypothetical protein
MNNKQSAKMHLEHSGILAAQKPLIQKLFILPPSHQEFVELLSHLEFLSISLKQQHSKVMMSTYN